MRRFALTLPLVALTLAAGPAQGATTFTIRGAGFGHGVGMSQYGAYGFAQHGWTHEQILAHYYTGTALGQAPANTVVRVLLQSGGSPTFTGVTNAGGRTLNASSTYRAATAPGGRVALLSSSGRRLGTYAAPLRVTTAGAPFRVVGGANAGAYRGWLELRPGTLGGVVTVDAVGLEQYVAGVIGGEMPSSWDLEALEVQAVALEMSVLRVLAREASLPPGAARTYAITTSKGGADGFDQYADTRSQVYKGVAGETPRTNQATNATAGQVVTYQGRPVTTFYFSTSGGRTEDNENIFGGTPSPWLRSVSDPYDSVSPLHRWGPLRYTTAQAGARLGGLVKGSFQTIRVVTRGSSPRVLAADVVGTGGTTRVTGLQLQARFGLRDTWMTFDALSADVEGYSDGSGDTPLPTAPTTVGAGGGTPPTTTPAKTPTATTPKATTPAGQGGGASAPRRLRMTGLVSFRRPGTPVVLERRTRGGHWHRAGHTHLGHTRHFKIKLTRPGVYRVRVGGAIGPTLRASTRSLAT